MSKIIVFALSLCVFGSATNSAPAASSVEAGIARWVAKLDGLEGWSAKYVNLTYDSASDTAQLTGLTVTNTSTSLEIVFEPISVAGYAEGPDGTFGARLVTSQSVTVSLIDRTYVIGRLRLEELGNLSEQLFAKRPLSPVQYASEFVDLQLTRGEVASFVGGSFLGAVAAEARNSFVSFGKLVIDNVAKGKIANLVMGPIKATAPDNVTRSAADVSIRNVDCAAILSLYGFLPSGAADDRPWLPVFEYFAVREMRAANTQGSGSIAEVKIEGLRMRRPEANFLAPAAGELPDPNSPPDFRRWSESVAVDRVSVRGVDIEEPLNGRINVGEFTVKGLSNDRLDEWSIDDFKLANDHLGSLKFGYAAVGDVTFPNVETLFDEPSYSAGLFDLSDSKIRVGFLELVELDVDLADMPSVSLEKLRVDLDNYVGPAATSVRADVRGIDLPAETIVDDVLRATWLGLGYDRIEASGRISMHWRESDETFAIEDLWLDIADVGTVSLTGVLSGVSREVFETKDPPPEVAGRISVAGATLRFEDDSVVNRAVTMHAAALGLEPDDLKREIASTLPGLIGLTGDRELRRVLEGFIVKPGTISATVAPETPVPLSLLFLVAMTNPANLPALLALKLESP